MNKIIFITTILLFITSCNQDNKNNGYRIDEEPEFGDRLMIEREDTSFYRYVGAKNEKRILQKGVVLKYHLTDGKINVKYSWGKGSVVDGCIVKYAINETFFIVEQKSLDDVFGKIKVVGNEVIRDRMPSTINKMRIILNQCDCSKYWIINIKTDDIYGPFKWNEFIQNRKKLGVPDELILKENDSLIRN